MNPKNTKSINQFLLFSSSHLSLLQRPGRPPELPHEALHGPYLQPSYAPPEPVARYRVTPLDHHSYEVLLGHKPHRLQVWEHLKALECLEGFPPKLWVLQQRVCIHHVELLDPCPSPHRL